MRTGTSWQMVNTSTLRVERGHNHTRIAPEKLVTLKAYRLVLASEHLDEVDLYYFCYYFMETPRSIFFQGISD